MAFRASEGGFSFKEAAEVVDEHLGARLEEMRRFTRGLRNSNFRLDLADGSTCVLRVFHGEDPAAQAVDVLALRHLAARPEAAGLPVPRVLGHGRGPESGSPYVLLTFLPGVNAGRGLPGLAEEERPAFAAALGGLMARLHSVPPPLPGFGRWLRVERDAVVPDGGPRPGALSFEQASFAHALRRCREEGLLSAEGARLAERFVARRWHAFDEREAAVFVHHDLHADNVLMEPRAAAEGGLRISGLLDFEHARGRAAEYDWVMAAWSLPEDGSDLALEAPGPLLRAFLEGYAAVRPLHPLWRERWLCYQMIKAVGFLAYKPAYVDFIEWNRRHVLRLASLDAG